MNPDTPSRQPRPIGPVLRYTFALLAGGVFAWMAWNPEPAPVSDGDIARDDSPRDGPNATTDSRLNRDQQPADSIITVGRSEALHREEAAPIDAAHNARIAPARNPSDAEFIASTPDSDSEETSDLHLRGPP